MKNPYAIGKSIYLRTPRSEDVEGRWHEWFSDPETTRFLGDRWWPNTVEQQRSFYEATLASKERLVLLICIRTTDETVGVCNISNISWVHRYADIALVIGEPQFRTGSIAIDALAMLVEIAFNRLNLLNLRSTHASDNPHTPLLEKLFGFREIGRFSKMAFSRGKYVDAVYSQLSREDWYTRNHPV